VQKRKSRCGMKDQDKTKQQLISELVQLRQRVAEFEANDQGGEPEARSASATTRPGDGPERNRLHAILTAAIECLPFEFFAIGPDGRYILQNAVSRQHAGDAIGKRPEDSAPDEYTRKLWLDNNRRAFAGERVEGEVEAHVGAETRTYYNIISPIQDGDKVCGILGVNVDITERKRAEKALRLSEEHHRVLTETMLQGVVHHDAEGTIIAMNPAAEHILGKTHEQFLGSSSTGEEHHTIREDGSLFPGVEHPAMVALQTGELVAGVVMGVFNPKVDAFRWINIDAVPLFRPGEARPYQVYAVFEDITERKRAKEALRKAHDELEAKVKERTAELSKANEQLKREVEERRRAEEALEESERQFRNYFEQGLIGMAVTSLDKRWLLVNDRLCDILGYSREELCQKTWPELTYPDDVEPNLQLFNRLLADEIEDFKLDKRFLKKDGSIVYTTIHVRALRKDDGSIDHIVALTEDITARKEAEEALRQSHAELRAIYDGMADGLLVADIETRRFVRANVSICRMLGYSEDELLSLEVKDLHPEADLPFVVKQFDALADGTLSVSEEIPVLRKDGTVFYAVVSSSRVTHSGRRCVVGFFRDVTERKQAQDSLRISEEKYRGVVEANPDAIVMSDLNGRVLFASRQTWGMLGLAESDELVGRSVFDYVIENDRKRLAGNMSNLVGVGIRRNTEYTAIRQDGTTVPTEVSSTLIRDAEGRPKAVMAVISDISERKRAEAALRRSEERYELAVRGAGVGIWDWDIRTGRLYFSPRWKAIFGYGENDIGESLEDWARLLHPDEKDWMLKFLKDFLAGTSSTVTVEYRLRHKDGSYRWIVAHGLVLRDEQGKAYRFVGSHGDITDRKRAEEALERERQSLWRMLQASDHERQIISYDIHDGLAQYLAAATMQFQSHDVLRENSPDEAKKAYGTAVELVRLAHSESRRLINEVRPPVIDENGIETAISHLVHEQRRQGGPKIECHSDVQFGRLPSILENAIYRIAQEALTNACKHSKTKKVTVTMAQEDQDVRLEVQDWGIGFDPESVEKGHFGLEGIRQRVRLLGGRLSIESKPGSGTLVRVVVPIVERKGEE